jgi:hypothetical protein
VLEPTKWAMPVWVRMDPKVTMRNSMIAWQCAIPRLPAILDKWSQKKRMISIPCTTTLPAPVFGSKKKGEGTYPPRWRRKPQGRSVPSPRCRKRRGKGWTFPCCVGNERGRVGPFPLPSKTGGVKPSLFFCGVASVQTKKEKKSGRTFAPAILILASETGGQGSFPARFAAVTRQ